MICKNKNNILRFTINETKFRHYRCNWVYMRRFVSGIRELGASVSDSCAESEQPTFDNLRSFRNSFFLSYCDFYDPCANNWYKG
jgi:hypothetical protein